MIESSVIRKFIIAYFVENVSKSLFEISGNIHAYLKSHFVPHEIVLVKSKGVRAKIQSTSNGRYVARTCHEGECETYEVLGEDIVRGEQVSKNNILRFLESVTKISPFGRILRENVLKEISSYQSKRQGVTRERSRHDTGMQAAGEMKSIKDYFVKSNDDNEKEPEYLDISEDASKDDEPTPSRRSTGARKGGESIAKKSTVKSTAKPRTNTGTDDTTVARAAPPARKSKFSSVTEALGALDCACIDVGGIQDLELFIEVYLFFSHFRKHFGMDISRDALGAALSEKSYGSEVAFKIHKALLDILVEEFRLVGSTHYKQLFENSLEICLGAPANAADVQIYTNYNWHETEVTEKNWKSVMKNFISYLFHVYELHGVTFYKEFTTRLDKDFVDDRLNILKFLIESSLGTTKFRQMVNANVEEVRACEKKKQDITAQIKKCKGEVPDVEKTKTPAEVADLEKELVENEREMAGSGYRADIAYVEGIQFFYLDGDICFWKGRSLHTLSADQIRSFLKAYSAPNKGYNSLISGLKSYVTLIPRQEASLESILSHTKI